jgi:hypothetical protein
VQERDNQLQLTLRRSAEGMSYKSSLQQSPTGGKVAMYPHEASQSSNQVVELQEQLKTKEEEIKILWNVIKEINKSKGSEKVSMEQLKQVISSKVNANVCEINKY